MNKYGGIENNNKESGIKKIRIAHKTMILISLLVGSEIINGKEKVDEILNECTTEKVIMTKGSSNGTLILTPDDKNMTLEYGYDGQTWNPYSPGSEIGKGRGIYYREICENDTGYGPKKHKSINGKLSTTIKVNIKKYEG